MKYFTQETTRKNYGKLYRFLMIAMLVMCGGMVMGQTDTWKPQSNTSATYILRSNGTTGNNFDVYQANENGMTPVGSNYTQINGRVNFAPDMVVTIIFENERTILFNGQFDFNGTGSSLTLQLGDISASGNPNIAHSADNPTLKIIGNDGYNNQKVAFFLRPTSSNNVSDRQLIIQGHNPTGSENYPTSYDFANNFVIDGDGPTLTIDTTNMGTPMSPYVTATSPGTIKDYGLFRLQQGSLTLKNVTVQNFSTSWNNGGMAQVFTNNATAGVDLLFEHCYFTNIGASSFSGSPVLRMQGGGGTNANRNATLKNCKIENIFGSNSLAVGQTTAIDNANATIRTLGNNKVPLTIEGCHLAHNYGCPVRWHGCGSSQKMTVKDCLIKNNFTCVGPNVNGGGGLLLKGPAQIQNCTIRNNRTNGSGGGIYLSTYTDFNNGTQGLIPEHSILQLDPTTLITNNTAALNGGGAAIEPVLMLNTYYDYYYENYGYLSSTEGYIYHTANGEPFTVKFVQNGATISNNKAYGHGGGVYISRPNTTTFYKTDCDLDKGSILNNHANYGGGGTGNGGGVAIVSTSTHDNPSSMPAFVHPQDVTVTISDESATSQMLIQGNDAINGGGIYLEAYPIEYNGVTSTVTTTVLDYSNIQNNTASTSGGGLYVERGTVSILKNNDNGTPKPTISKNTATNGNGGGVYTHQGNIDINPTGDERNATQITNNTAAINGGGLNTHHGFITVQGNNKDQRVIIKNNTATTGSGGAIFCMGENANAEYITVRHTDLVSNKALNGGATYENGSTVAAGCGGGIYLQQGKITITDVNIQNNYAKVNGGGINNHSGSIDVNGCYIGSSHSTSGDHYYNADATDTDRGNKADNSGGGIYTRLGDIDIEDYVETSGNIFREESKVTFNEAAKNGGGIDTREGIIYINKEEEDDQIEVAFNKAERGGGLYANAGTIVAYNALIHDNTATLHGGGANNHSGDIIIYGGILSNNIAKEGHGGGAYTNVGDIDLFQFPSTNLNPNLNHGTKVYNNIAKLNGGAFNNHTGRVDVRHATIYNNTATLGNGGAIFCEGPHSNDNRGLGYTIRLLCSDMVQNKTRGQDGTATDPTGRGGGIYLKYGSIYAHYSNILNNEANINGGGIDNHSGDMLLYGCDVIGNRANEGDGGGIFTYQGDITIGPSTMRDGSNQSKASLVDNNSAHVDGGGINNQDGNININGAQITNNTAHNGNGGGIFITGNIDMKAGRIGENTAKKGNSENGGKGGGVYSGGGLFNIHEREENPEPIVLIVDTEVDRNRDNNGNVISAGEPGAGQNATVHYHLVDQGKYGTGVTNVEHGIVWGTTEDPTTQVIYGSSAGTTNGYTYTQGEPACERITIPSSMITAGTTYYAKAFYRYTTGGNVITGFSETIKFVTFSDSEPLVISGSVSNITKNSAQGSGRVMDNGGYNITARGVAIKKESDVNFTLIPSTETTEFFTVDLTSLDANTKYIAKAYATNSNGTSYGNEVKFTTLKDTPDMGDGVVTVTTSIENDVIVARASFTMPAGTTFGEQSVIKGYGFVWSRDDDPELSTDHTIAGTLTQGTTTFTATYRNVTPGITFYVRAYATTVENVVTPDSDITDYSITAATQHVAPMLDGSPVVRAIGISGITQTSATITCQIYSGYEDETTQYGVHLDNYTETNPANTYTSAFIPSNNATPNDPEHQIYYPYTYTVQLTNLKPGTTYYLKAYGTNVSNPTSEDYNFGNGYNFTALPIMQPNVVITSVGNIQKTSATINCSVEDGGGSITAYGIKYSTDPNMPDNAPTIAGNNLSGNTFSVELDNTDHNLLTAHTTYYVQAYATNSAGTHTCQAVSFTTDYDHPSVAFTNSGTTIPISGVGFSITDNGNNEYNYQYTAVGNYTVTPHDASEPVQTHGVCWSIFHNPTRRHSAVSDSHYAETTEEITSQTPKSTTFHPAYPNTKYYVHAYVSTSTPDPDANNELADIVYDPVNSNITFVSLPIVHTGGATAITNSSASLTVNINSPDREHHLRKYGVCWTESTTEDPTRAEGYYVEGDITAANPTAVSYNLTANVGANEGTSKTYRYRAYCINENSDAQGNIAYGDIKEFTTTAYTITGTTNPTEAGWVSYGGNLTTGGGWDGSSSITVEAHTNDGWHFENWTLDNGTSSHSSSNPLTETPSAGNHTYQANFKAIVSATVNPENTGSVSGIGNYAVGTTCTLTATAESGYVFLYWTDDAGNVIMDATGDTPEDNTYDFTVVGPVTVTANFGSNRRSTSMNTSPRPRDIYPAPAREPWDWEDDFVEMVCTPSQQMDSTNSNIADTIVPAQPMRTANENLPSIDHNTAEEGGGIYIANGGKILFSSGSINLNEAHVNGGGIYLEQGSIMHMKNICEVNGNHTPDFSLTEDANGNPVIVGGGAGIYLDGKLYLGNKIDDAKGTHRLTVDKNYAMTGFTETAYTQGDYNNSYYLRNNVFLPYTTNKQAPGYFDAYSDFTNNASATPPDNSKTRVIALLSDISNDENESYSHIGFSVTKGKIPVIATAKKANQDLDNLNFLEYGIYEYGNGNQQNTEEWMNTITGRMNSTNAANASIFDDARAYIAIHARQDDDPFRNDFIYLWDCWTTPIVKYDPAHYDMYGHELAQQDDSHYTIDDNGLWHIKDEKGLAWFSANVNRLNGTKGSYNDDSYASLNAVLEADLDMTEYLWVPIGSVRQVDDNINTIFRDIDDGTDKLGYRGTFNGQGHVIKGIDCRYISSLVKYGLFGNLEEGANVYNTFVDASSFRTNDDNTTYHVGGIAGLVEQGATISTSEARATIDVTHAKKATSYVGGLVGKAEGTTEHPTLIHSSMAMPEIIGTVDYMGGLVGQLGVSGSAKCDLFNSFANPKFPNATTSPYYVMNNGKYIGGLVGENNGTVENCYSRLQGDEPTSDGTNSVFGWFAGTNNTNINYCYAPRVANESGYDYTTFKYKREGTGTITDPDNYGTTLRYSGKYGFKHRDHQMRFANNTYEQALAAGKASANDTLIGGLQFTLNRWVNATNGNTSKYSTWTRTMASPINDDYPILEFADFNAVGSEDSIYMLYNTDVNPMITAFNAVDASKHPTPSIYLYDVNPTTLNVSNDDNVMLAINEDVGILQSVPLKARVGVTIRNTRKGANDYTDDPNWHLFSSAIKNVPMGLDYHTSEASNSSYVTNIVNKTSHPESVWGDRNQFDPPMTTWFQSDNAQAASYNPNQIGYFPTNTPYGTWRPTNGGQSAAAVGGFFDLFDYSEKYYHWMNYKREGTVAIQDHWHYDKDAQDKNHYKISGYRNDVTMLAGKGYLMALSGESMMMADGTLNTGGISHTVTKTAVGSNLPPHGHGTYAYDEPYRSLNIAGNPYQSYLDFYQFVFNEEANNSSLLFSDNGTTYSYATRSADGKTYEYFTITQSENPETAGPYLHPHQGFFVKVTGNGDLNFNDNMRVAGTSTSLNSPYRDRLNYPLVNLFCYDANGKRDYTTVEISRPEAGGGHKMENLCMSDAQIYARYNDDNYQILFAPEGVNVVPVRCKVIEDGYFTMRWSTYHGDFSYLHLIDNLTGTDVDCLTTDEYKFEGKASDYNSRFKLVFDCTGIDEPETPEPDEGPTVFAFQMGDELIVNGEGMLQMFDLNGRCLMTRQAVGQQSNVSLPQVAAGMYLLRLTSNKQVRVQKMVIK